MNYTTRHYVEIAGILNKTLLGNKFSTNIPTYPIEKTINDFIKMFELDNPKFNKGTFKKAVYKDLGKLLFKQ